MEHCYTLADLLYTTLDLGWSVAFTPDYMFTIFMGGQGVDYTYVPSIDQYCSLDGQGH